ncbi:uncharacterized protein LOC131956838 [Physella acuta]|uniref:uncharacterized protein LOC131956838 n=1 Tax=Physella acuta TaxID=109671 RepID=UPI0027DD4F02|nr:uncharacterized protein LOC131956838 [Physella acuta]XP_059177430.1 uncharacterized protein LOC131956838 [Physella acuta]
MVSLKQTEEVYIEHGQTWENGWDSCTKKTNHDDFINISELIGNKLINKDYHGVKITEDLNTCLCLLADLTGRIQIPLGADNKYGTGFVQKVRKSKVGGCPCPECVRNKQSKKDWAILSITIVLHVLPEQAEAEKCVLHLFCDDEQKADEVKTDEQKADEQKAEEQRADEQKADEQRADEQKADEVKTDEQNADKQKADAQKADEEKTDAQKKIEPKTVYGRRLADTDKERGDNDWCFVECVTHDMDLVGKLEKTIKDFNDLQKKLYQQYKNNKEKQLVVIVSHPHGGPKRISFGHTVEKKSLKDVRENQNWCNYSYNTATCPGSSGAYVFILGQPLCGSGYWFGHPHNHSHYTGAQLINCSSIGVDHIG